MGQRSRLAYRGRREGRTVEDGRIHGYSPAWDDAHRWAQDVWSDHVTRGTSSSACRLVASLSGIALDPTDDDCAQLTHTNQGGPLVDVNGNDSSGWRNVGALRSERNAGE